MTITLEPVRTPPANGGIVPPWLQYPIVALPMPEPPAESLPGDDDE